MGKELIALEVGKEFPMFINSKRNMVNADGCIFEILPENDYIICIYMRGMNKNEISALRYEKIKCKYIQEGDFILPLIRYGNTELIFELNLDPTLYKDGRGNNLLKTNMLTIVGIESMTNVINTLRYCNFPVRLYSKLITIWDKAKDINNYSDKYTRWVNDIDNRYSLVQLWDMGIYIGKMGE